MNKLTIRSLVAAAVASLALVAVGPANAEDNKPPTQTKNGCEIKTPSGGDFYPHGSTMTVTMSDGQKYTYRCNDGKWEEVKKRTISGAVITVPTGGTLTVSDGGGTLVITEPKIDSGAVTPVINPVIAP